MRTASETKQEAKCFCHPERSEGYPAALLLSSSVASHSSSVGNCIQHLRSFYACPPRLCDALSIYVNSASVGLQQKYHAERRGWCFLLTALHWHRSASHAFLVDLVLIMGVIVIHFSPSVHHHLLHRHHHQIYKASILILSLLLLFDEQFLSHP